MDPLNSEPLPKETRTGRDCQFCRCFGPEFGKRDLMDRLVHSEVQHTATARLTKNDHIKHRLLEITMRLGLVAYAA